MEEERLLSNIRLNKKPLSECSLVLECNSGLYRLYMDKHGIGFFAVAVEFASATVEECSHWDRECVWVKTLLTVTACIDGIRHLYVNSDAGNKSGYIHYPNMEGMIQILSKLRELELEHCPECDR